MRTRNFRVRNEIVEREEQYPRVKKERKLTLRGKWEDAISGMQMDSVLKKTLVVSVLI